MVEFLERAAAVDTFTLFIVGMLSGWAGVLVLHVLSRTALALIFVPGFSIGALITNYVFELTGIFPTHDRQTNTVIACTVGIIVALFVLMIVTRATTAIAALPVQRHRFKRDVAQDAPYRRELRA